ncbi:MAG: hypothetical protein CME63_16115 [Halobacteriovoraceae bacterium]|nr:hypothetical protein [Halobacteriovoraceae bacterium]|tara:strand:- start:84853 stop:86526 length:1674 start_codon:yes stop_codon:yes gene_type:complete
MEVFKIIYSVLGGLGIFFYGMKSMSEALQSVAGDVIKNIINTLTKNRVYALLVGIIVTMLVQSSSVTTVMVVGFVNAGLMQLTQAIGIIFGANIGTTITGWIISIKVGKYGLLFIGLGIFPMLFAKRNNWRQIGKVLFGIGMVFFGLDIMSGAFKPLRSMPEFLDAISYFSGQHYGAYIASIIVGCLLTVVIQSSSAMLGITMALATTGVIPFHTAAALVLGENIGTTITALLASVGGNVNAIRASRAHAVFNLLGVSVIFSLFPYYVELIDYIVPGNPAEVGANGEFTNVAVHIASGHTIFNVASALIFLPFLKTLAAFVTKLTPDRGTKEQHHLKMLGDPKAVVPATALVQAKAETDKMKDIIDRMYKNIEEIYSGELSEADRKIRRAKVRDYEKITDNIQKEITIFLIKVQEMALSRKESVMAQSLTRIADELESIADYLAALANYSERSKLEEVLYNGAAKDFFALYKDVKSYYEETSGQFVHNEPNDMSVVKRRSANLREEANDIRDRHLQRVGQGEYPALSAITYSDMIVALRKIRSHSENVAQAHSYTLK